MNAKRAIVLGATLLTLVSTAAEAAPNDITIKLSPQEWTILINSAQTSISEIIGKIQAQYREQAATKIKAARPPVALARPQPPHRPKN